MDNYYQNYYVGFLDWLKKEYTVLYHLIHMESIMEDINTCTKEYDHFWMDDAVVNAVASYINPKSLLSRQIVYKLFVDFCRENTDTVVEQSIETMENSSGSIFLLVDDSSVPVGEIEESIVAEKSVSDEEVGSEADVSIEQMDSVDEKEALGTEQIQENGLAGNEVTTANEVPETIVNPQDFVKEENPVNELEAAVIETEDEPIENADDTDEVKNNSLPNAQEPEKHTVPALSSEERLFRRIREQFSVVPFIGDIMVTDQEYRLLRRYFTDIYCKHLHHEYPEVINDPIYCTALVQIGIRCYEEGNFWQRLTDEIRSPAITWESRNWLKNAFVHTLKIHNKAVIEEDDGIFNILMHGFVSNEAAEDFFNFLLAYYTMDLERDLERNTDEMMEELVNSIISDYTKDRTYLVRKQTGYALACEKNAGIEKICRYLKQIDQSFWDPSETDFADHEDRLSVALQRWMYSAEEVQKAQNTNQYIGTCQKYRKAPYLICNANEHTFALMLPVQLLKITENDIVTWRISTPAHSWTREAIIYPAYVGYKTESEMISIPAEDLFQLFSCELLVNDKRVGNIYHIAEDCVRFFDEDGDMIRTDLLPHGKIWAYTPMQGSIESEAVVSTEEIPPLSVTILDLKKGDRLRLHNGQYLAVSMYLKEGLIQDGTVTDVAVVSEKGERFKLYDKAPVLLLKIKESRLNGTAMSVNGKVLRLQDETLPEEAVREVMLFDRSGETGYYVDLSYYGCQNDGLYHIRVDVPGDFTKRDWSFAVVHGFAYKFEDSPYIFQQNGILSLPDGLSVELKNPFLERDGNSFSFKLTPDQTLMQVYLSSIETIAEIPIPMVRWSFDETNWNIMPPLDIWHQSFPGSIYFTGPYSQVTLSLTRNNTADVHQQTYIKTARQESCACDVNFMRSWFDKSEERMQVWIQFPQQKDMLPTSFCKVIMHSRVASHSLTYDYVNQIMKAQFDIIGGADYYADIRNGDEIICEKAQISNGMIIIENDLPSGNYQTIVYEGNVSEEDDWGFGNKEYAEIGNYTDTLLNPGDLSGTVMRIRHILRKSTETGSEYQHRLGCSYFITARERRPGETYQYSGVLTAIDDQQLLITEQDIMLSFIDPENLTQVVMWLNTSSADDQLMYDTKRKIIIPPEKMDHRLSLPKKNKRYILLDPSYVAMVRYEAEPVAIKGKSSISHEPEEDDTDIVFIKREDDRPMIRLDDVVCSAKTKFVLKNAGLEYVEDVKRVISQIKKSSGIDDEMYEEILKILHSCGYTIQENMKRQKSE